MARPSPLFRVDPGWIWIAVGLVTVFVATVVPAQRRLEQDRAELRRLQAAERRTYQLLEAHDQFLSDLREGQPSLLRRLAAASLNRMPEGDEAWILADSIDQNPIAWIDSTIPVESPPPPGRRSLLERLVGGRVGLWSTAFGVFCLFVGLVVGPGTLSPARRRDEGPAWPPAAGPAVALTTLERGTLLVESPRDAGAEEEAGIGAEDLRRWAPRIELPSDAAIDPTLDAPVDQSIDPAIDASIDEESTAVPALFEVEPPATAEAVDATTAARDEAVVLGGQPELESWTEEVGKDASNDHEVERLAIAEPEKVVDSGQPIPAGVIAADHALVLISTTSGESSPERSEDRATLEAFRDSRDLPIPTLDRAESQTTSIELAPSEPRRAATTRSLVGFGAASGAAATTSSFDWSEGAVVPLELLGCTFILDRGATSPTPSDLPTEASDGGGAKVGGVIAEENQEFDALDEEVEDDDELEEVHASEDAIEGDLDDEADEDSIDDADPPIIELHVDQADADPVNAGEPLDPPWQDESDRR